MRTTVRRSILCLALPVATGLGLVLAPATAAAEPVEPVASLDLDRYLGTWNQLAAIPQPFNLNCAGDTTATYGRGEAGEVTVFNHCRTWTGGVDEIRGIATVNDPVTNARLHVSFPGVPTQDSPTGPTNYIVTALAPDYTWALVTSPTRTSGFVLSRTPGLDAATWDRIDAEIVAAGQSPCVYLTTPTTGGRSDITPLCTR